MIGFWISIINGKQSKLSNILYTILLNETNSNIYEHNWIHAMKNILISVSKTDLIKSILPTDRINNPRATKDSISGTLNDLYTREWQAKLNSSSKAKSIQFTNMTSVLKSILLIYQRDTICLFVNLDQAIIDCQLKLDGGKIYQLMSEFVIYVTKIFVMNSITYLIVRFLMKKEKCTLSRFSTYSQIS